MKLINSALADFYNKSNEDTRLQTGLGPLEFERNKILINRYAGTRPLHIADIGGGTGHYASWLSALGHKVTLVDPLPKHIEKAKRKTGSFRCILGEARHLPFNNASFDLVILHGPLYHLQRQNDRLLAIKEARRIVRPGGMVLGFAITHSASALAALHNGMIHDTQIFHMCSSELLTGEHHAPDDLNGILQCAYYHRPDELLNEFIQSGFHINGLHAVEGMAWMDHNFFESWHDLQKKKNLMELISMTDQDQSLLCLSPHMMVSASPFL
ncbi:class I SAM-dependent methyltransferase [Pedobacter africanus]|uniref:Methyltransferase domain-containing protein n=1 Tax=Pedobacter africanus TaxID=151894 RepID=A0A1W1YZB6_9SPHI|nr:class I SAM-dependent methyltransferase [Pedobacter africanus]SMC41540.1 Methyltransferase domain-containing protein [Pedobacter africanus]